MCFGNIHTHTHTQPPKPQPKRSGSGGGGLFGEEGEEDDIFSLSTSAVKKARLDASAETLWTLYLDLCTLDICYTYTFPPFPPPPPPLTPTPIHAHTHTLSTGLSQQAHHSQKMRRKEKFCLSHTVSLTVTAWTRVKTSSHQNSLNLSR